MAMPGQPPVQGGLGAMAPAKPVPQKEPSEAQDAARVSAMEQDTILSPEEVARKALVDRKAQSQALESQIRLLTQSLDSRMKPSFDAPLMNLAAGLLKPTRTGSFGESLGYGLEGYSKAAQEEAMQKQAIEKQRLEYMQKLAEIQNQQSLTDFDLASLGPQAKTVLRTGAESAPMGAPAPVTQAPGEAGRATPPMVAGAPSAAPAAPAGGMEFPQVSRNPMTVDKANLARMMSPDRGKLAYDQLEAERKQMELELKKIDTRRGQIIQTPLGMWDTDKQDWVQKDPYVQKSEKFDFGPFNPPGQDGRLASQKQIREYQAIDKSDTNAMIKFAVAQGWLSPSALPPSAGPAPAGGGAAPTGGATSPSLAPPVGANKKSEANPLGLPTKLKTEEEKREETLQDAVRKAALEALESQRAKDSETRATATFNAGRTAPTLRAIGKDMEGWATNNPRIFDLLQRPEVGDRFKKFVEAGLSAGQFGTFSLPVTILEQNKNNKITTEDLQALQMFAQASAKLTTEMRKISRSPGEGATDAKEGELYARVEALPSDSSQVIRLKSELLQLRADFDEATARQWLKYRKENKGASFDEFLFESDSFKSLRENYDKALDARREANMKLLQSPIKPATKPAAPAAPAAPASPTQNKPAEKPNERIIGGTIWERQPDGSWNNTGRKP